MEERQRRQKQFLAQLKASTYTRVWNACLDVSLSRGKLRPAFETWKQTTETINRAEQQQAEVQANPIAEASVDIYTKIIMDTDAVARVDGTTLASVCKTGQLALMQGRAPGQTHAAVVRGRYAVLEQESIRWPITAVISNV